MTNIIADINDNRHVFKSSVDHFFSKINISKQLKISNFHKESGFSCTKILKPKELFTLVFTGKNLYRSLLSDDALLTFRRNTAYRFINSGHFNWEKLLYKVMSQLISEIDHFTADLENTTGFIHTHLTERSPFELSIQWSETRSQ